MIMLNYETSKHTQHRPAHRILWGNKSCPRLALSSGLNLFEDPQSISIEIKMGEWNKLASTPQRVDR